MKIIDYAVEKMGEKRQRTKGEIQIVIKHTQRYSAILIVRKCKQNY